MLKMWHARLVVPLRVSFVLFFSLLILTFPFTSDLVTYFGQETNANSKYNAKQGLAYVTGAMKLEVLQGLVFKFIAAFVTCKSCTNPETDLSFEGKKKDQKIKMHCKSCGHDDYVDAVERLCKHILLHPQEEKENPYEKRCLRPFLFQV